MRLLRADAEACEFRLGRREKQLFCALLRQYPLVPLEHHCLARGPAETADGAHQAWLTESMAAQRDEARRRLDAFLADENRFVAEPEGLRLRITREAAEWLLQILNDLRVGSWLRLGSPAAAAAGRHG
jgi:hypothetical protein